MANKQDILNAFRVRKWSRQHECCVQCGTTTIKHNAGGLCLSCYGKKYIKANFKRMQIHWREYHKRRWLDPKVKEASRKMSNKMRKKYPEKWKARQDLKNAIHRGLMERGACEVCGGIGEGHHEDYSKPLDVKWLCRQHHENYHHNIHG